MKPFNITLSLPPPLFLPLYMILLCPVFVCLSFIAYTTTFREDHSLIFMNTEMCCVGVKMLSAILPTRPATLSPTKATLYRTKLAY